MESLREYMRVYREQMLAGTLPKAYQGLMQYILDLRSHFQSKYPDFQVPGSIYFGYMDMTYFSASPKSLKDRGLKIAIVFVHETCRFEVWLAASNKQIQARYWNLIKESGWDRYRLVPTVKGYDAIVETGLASDPDFGDLPALTAQIESGTLRFIADIEQFLDSQ